MHTITVFVCILVGILLFAALCTPPAAILDINPGAHTPCLLLPMFSCFVRSCSTRVYTHTLTSALCMGCRYEALQAQLAAAQALAEQEDEEAELARAAAAVARLTAPSSPNGAAAATAATGTSGRGSKLGVEGDGTAGQTSRSETAAKVKLLEEAVMEARESVRIGDDPHEDNGDGDMVADGSHGPVPATKRR